MECLKAAAVIPLIKDLDDIVDKDNQKNYRPITNLKFVGKLIERVVSAQLQNHMKIEPEFQLIIWVQKRSFYRNSSTTCCQ